MSGIFSKPKAPPPPEPPPPAPTMASADVTVAAEAERKRLRGQQGRASTVLTSGAGLIGDESTASKALLS